MIGFIKGKLKNIKENSCIVLTNSGVGYEIFIPLSYFNNNTITLGEDIELFIKTIVKDNTIELYGFLKEEEKSMFTKLISISKLGPKTSLSMLSHLNTDQIIDAIYKEDVSSLSRVPGIGQKTAKRIILELKEKIKSSITISNKKLEKTMSPVFNEALSGLLNLGYREDEVYNKLKQVLELEPDLLVEEAIRKVLKNMAD